MRLVAAFLAASLLACGGAFAQPDAKSDREKARNAVAKARKACEGKQDQEHRDCMRRQICAQSKDPAACEARVKEAAARHAKMREACTGKAGAELRTCLREQRDQEKSK